MVGSASAARFIVSTSTRYRRTSFMAFAETMCDPVLKADVVQNISPGRSKTFRICSRPSGLARKHFTRPEIRM
jgi:hypothetical protein